MNNIKDESFKKAESKLYNYNRLKAEINYLNLEIKKKESSYLGCKAMGYSEKTSQTYDISSSVENEIMRKEKEIENIRKEVESKEILIEKIDNAMSILNEEEIALIQYRYFSKRSNSWGFISDSIGFSPTQCKKMRIEIINKVKYLLS
ncbi:transcriptional regulator [Clostridioides difficile]|nr:transcriptional regulator [Clostridioides difficile]HBF7249299.1 transcriptional regulator [Clostridioides difficile]HBG5343088.1 transcriptional regulator [Clostridioides difficile]